MKTETRKKTSRRGAWLVRFGTTAVVAVVLATALLPLSALQVAAEEDEVKIVAIDATVDPPGEDEDEGEGKDPLVVDAVLVVDEGGDDPEPPDDDPVIDVEIAAEPEVTPEPDVTPELGDPVALGGVQINKLWCDADYGADYNALAANCGSGGSATFHVYGSYDEQTFEAGSFEADLATPDSIAVVEDLPAGYGAPIVFCMIYIPQGGGGAYDLDQAEAYWYSDAETATEHARVEADLGPGEYLYCDWFNIPLDEGQEDQGVVVVHKWDCPADTDATSEDWTYFQGQCPAAMNGVAFDLTPDGDPAIQKITGDEGVDGEAVWTGLAATPIVISELIPAGYGDPVVFCGWGAIYDEDGDGIAIAIDGIVPPDAVVGGVLEHELYPNEQLYCDWFNIPSDDEDGSITIQKWLCPVNYNIDDPAADPSLDCTEKLNGITFGLAGDSVIFLDTATGDVIDGQVYWGGLDAGDYQVGETIPDGMVAILVTCTWYEDLGPYVYDTLIPTENGVIDLSLAEGDDVVCDWYNIPFEDDDESDGGKLIVIKYWCDDAIYTADACELYGGDVDFVLQSASGESDPIYFNTGGDGSHELYLPAGAYSLDEVDADWCQAASADVDGDGNVVVSDDHTSTVEVFNCGPGKKEPPAKKFPNTGAGPMSSETRHDLAVPALLAVASVALLLGARMGSSRVRKPL